MQELYCPSYFVAGPMPGACETGEGKHGYSRNHLKAAGVVRCAQSDLDQVFCGRINVHAGIGQEEEFAAARHDGITAGNSIARFVMQDGWCPGNVV
jgi:hypothetical protein